MRNDIPKNNPDDITEESLAAFFAELNARLDAEAAANAPSEAAQALAASWQPKPAVRTMAELEAALDDHYAAKWLRVTLAAVEAGNSSDARAFATRLTSHYRQRQADALAFGDEPQLLADIQDERAFALAA